MTSLATRILAPMVTVAAAVLVSSCSSSSDDQAGHDQSSTAVGVPQPAGHNAADMTFVTDMMPHHQQAVDMSALVPDRSTNPAVVSLAAAISAAQEPEIQAMRVFLVQWDDNPDSDQSGQESQGHPADHGDMTMPGMVDAATMARLASLKGTEFDTLWLQSMIGHHEGAIAMAQTEIADGSNVDAKRMASDIVTAQQGEITQMKQMLGG